MRFFSSNNHFGESPLFCVGKRERKKKREQKYGGVVFLTYCLYKYGSYLTKDLGREIENSILLLRVSSLDIRHETIDDYGHKRSCDTVS